MQLYPLKLVTVVGESLIMEDIAELGLKLGATGYTISEVVGHGSRSARNVGATSGARTLKVEFVVTTEVAARILQEVSHEYFEHYAIIAWLSDVSVMRGERYTRTMDD
ncbi:MAG: transcriptional regulator [Planctomycetia bacterium]|nr:transcriptional regulator [Planctomycetia bacterium]